MTLDYLALFIKYNIKSNQFEIKGNVEKRISFNFFKRTNGAGEDNSKPNEKRCISYSVGMISRR